MPRADLEEMPVIPVPPPPPPQRAGQPKNAPGGGDQRTAQKAAAAVKTKKIPRKPLILHVIAVPDQGGTWIGFGLDGKLVAQKAAASLSTAPDTATLGKMAGADALRDVKANGAWLATIRGFLVFTALDHGSHGPYSMLGSLPSKGATPIVLTFVSQGPSQANAGGSALATFKLPRGAIEDIVRLAMSR